MFFVFFFSAAPLFTLLRAGRVQLSTALSRGARGAFTNAGNKCLVQEGEFFQTYPRTLHLPNYLDRYN